MLDTMSNIVRRDELVDIAELHAMDEAVAFAEWIVINEYQQIAKVWYFDTTIIAKTTTELYQLFKNR